MMNKKVWIIFLLVAISMSTLVSCALEPEYNSRRQLLNQQCGKNSFFRFCAQNCPATCADRTPSKHDCAKICKSGCDCKFGYVYKDAKATECIPVGKC
ncbi:hypothetical protein BLOT_012491 [Blomia tropicalis]|nr:hypothetical protein BLOT_012491 [Blomia tropicalis]